MKKGKDQRESIESRADGTAKSKQSSLPAIVALRPIAVRTAEAARLIGVSEVWLNKIRKSDPDSGPNFRRRGRMVLYPIAELEKWACGESVRTGVSE